MPECPEPVQLPPTLQITSLAQNDEGACPTCNMWEALSNAFTMPAVGGSGVIAVCDSADYGVGAHVWIEDLGFLEITARPNAQSLAVQNNGTRGNALPGGIAPAGNLILHCPGPLAPVVLDHFPIAPDNTRPLIQAGILQSLVMTAGTMDELLGAIVFPTPYPAGTVPVVVLTLHCRDAVPVLAELGVVTHANLDETGFEIYGYNNFAGPMTVDVHWFAFGDALV